MLQASCGVSFCCSAALGGVGWPGAQSRVVGMNGVLCWAVGQALVLFNPFLLLFRRKNPHVVCTQIDKYATAPLILYMLSAIHAESDTVSASDERIYRSKMLPSSSPSLVILTRYSVDNIINSTRHIYPIPSYRQRATQKRESKENEERDVTCSSPTPSA